MRFKNPELLLLLLTLIPLIWVYIRRERTTKLAVKFSDLSIIKSISRSAATQFRHIPFVVRCVGVVLLVIALARPQQGRQEEEISTDGVDIMLVLDISYSMKALDFKPDNRLAVAKQTIADFIAKRHSDRIGLVVFAKRSFTKCPLTLDYNVLTTFLEDTDFSDFSDATAIGTALATAASRLKDSHAKSKVIVLLTDGANNAGEIAPLAAAQAAGELGIKIYSIGIGKEGMVPIPVQMVDQFTGRQIGEQIQMMKSDLNEQELTNVADATKGRFFRAQDPEQLKEIYSTIDKLEKTEIKTKSYTSWADKFYWWLVIGALLLFAELLLANTRFRRIP